MRGTGQTEDRERCRAVAWNTVGLCLKLICQHFARGDFTDLSASVRA